MVVFFVVLRVLETNGCLCIIKRGFSPPYRLIGVEGNEVPLLNNFFSNINMEIEEPINITIESREETEQKQKKADTRTEKRVPTPKQIEQLKKAREAKAIKKKAIEMMEITSTPKESNQTLSPSYNFTEYTKSYTQYITPLLCLLGTIGGVYVFKKKTSTNSATTTQEQQENYSKLQLNF